MVDTPAVNPPDVSYARSGDVAIAYQIVGSGPIDIVFVRGITGDLLSTWEQPLLVRHVEGLAQCRRALMLVKRGTGLSDRVREASRRLWCWVQAASPAVSCRRSSANPEARLERC
jgi:hypothetical protein